VTLTLTEREVVTVVSESLCRFSCYAGLCCIQNDQTQIKSTLTLSHTVRHNVLFAV